MAAGAIAMTALKKQGIEIATHISRIGSVSDRGFENLEEDMKALNEMNFAVLDSEAEEKMRSVILEARSQGDSVGGVLETAVTGMPEGTGEPWFDTVESVLAHILFSVPAVKGVEFGDGFALAGMRGSEANDPFRIRDGAVVTTTNHNGGINGGITNGMPVIFRCAVKPTPTISQLQDTIDLENFSNTTIEAKGRHDPCIVHRARVVIDSVTALALYDLLAGRYGTDWFLGEE